MKQIFSLLLLLATLTMVVACGKPSETPKVSEGLAYQNLPDGTCGVEGVGSCTDTEIVIPDAAPSGKRVTAILGYAFQDQTTLTSVKIPSTVTTIGAYAFAGCTGLTSITLPDGTKEIGLYAFSRCEGLRQVYLGSSLTQIADGAFFGCASLQYAFFRGGATQWGKVTVGAGNSALTLSGVLHLYSAVPPMDNGSYWYYQNGSIGIW